MATSGDWPIEAVWPNEDNPRIDIRSDSGFGGLVASIRQQGIIQPLLIADDGMILAGHRRYEAALVIGLERVPVRVLKNKGTHHLIPLIENLQRTDLGVLEAADYFLKCNRQHDMSIVEISEATGISVSTIRQYLKLAEGPKEIRERIERDEIPLNAAFELLRHDDEFISQVISEPQLTKQIVRDRASAFGTGKPRPATWKSQSPAPTPVASAVAKCPTGRKAHIEYAIRAVRELLSTAPDEVFATRYKRWVTLMEDDLADEEAKQDLTPTFSGAVNAFQRQPKRATV